MNTTTSLLIVCAMVVAVAGLGTGNPWALGALGVAIKAIRDQHRDS